MGAEKLSLGPLTGPDRNAAKKQRAGLVEARINNDRAPQDSRLGAISVLIIIIIIINPLTARVVGAPQIILQPIFSIFPVLHCPLGLAELQACPFPNVVFPSLPLSASNTWVQL